MTSTSGRVRVAVVGAGVMGRYHALNYAAIPRAELVGIVDPVPDRRAAARQDFGCETFASVDDMLAVRRVDAVSVAVPTSLHYHVTKRLLLSGVHVLVDRTQIIVSQGRPDEPPAAAGRDG